MLLRHFRVIALTLALSLGACVHDNPTAGADPRLTALPRQLPSNEYLSALGGGRLVLDNGCLRLQGREGASRLILWPAGAEVVPGAIGVRDTTTGSAVMLGDDVVLGGGEVDAIDRSRLERALPAACEGPYFLAAPGFFPAPREDWVTHRVDDRYAIQLPRDMLQVATTPGSPHVWRRPGLTVTLRDDVQACAPGGLNDRRLSSHAYVDQRSMSLTRRYTSDVGMPVALDAFIPGVDGPRGPATHDGRCLAMRAVCATERDCDLARSAFSTTRIGDLGTPG